MATHSSTLAWKIPWTKEPGRLQSMWSLSQTGLSDSTFTFHFHFSLSCIGGRNGNPLHYSCLENPRDGGAWWAAICGVAQSWTRLKQLSSSSSNKHHLSPEAFEFCFTATIPCGYFEGQKIAGQNQSVCFGQSS